MIHLYWDKRSRSSWELSGCMMSHSGLKGVGADITRRLADMVEER
jgi:hypothetical protein